MAFHVLPWPSISFHPPFNSFDLTSSSGCCSARIKAGAALSHEAVFASVSKPTDAKFGVALEGGSTAAYRPPTGDMAHYVWDQPAAELARIKVLGSVLAGSGLEVGDELLWVDENECRGPSSRCSQFLSFAKAKEVQIVARRPRVVIAAEVTAVLGPASG